ncbi:MAG TPA: adenylate/guanylate cyclase domain-containing protein [Anaerolineaceae bacterium]|nr:adenylate/guanylate cyclase domain-containing protein [Anaerolineaceae bacterium]
MGNVNEFAAAYRKANRRMDWITLAGNTFGALLTYVFLALLFPVGRSGPTGQSDAVSVILFVVSLVALLAGGSFIAGGSSRLVDVWAKKRLAGLPPDAVPEKALRAVLNLPLISALTSLFMWLVGGLIFGSFAAGLLSGEWDWGSFWLIFQALVLFTGIMVSGLVFFGADYVWQPVVMYFFHGISLQRVRAFRLPVLPRLLLVFLLVTLWPMTLLMMVSMDRAQALLATWNTHAVMQNMFTSELFILGFSLLISVSMAIFVTRGLTDPLHRLEKAMKQVADNNLNIHAPVHANDELGVVTDGFNQMVAGLRQGERVRTLLNLYVTPEVARQAVEHGAQLGGQMVECSVLFADIRNFTGLSEQLEPSALIETLNRYMTLMVSAIVTQGGMVNKFGGDSLLAVFGTPLNPAEDHAARAAQAARDMLSALEKFNQSQSQSALPELSIGIGVASGPVVAGNVGSAERLEYTVIGDTVNLAARLQDKTKETRFPILLHGETFRQASTSMELRVEHLPEMAIRGKQEAVAVYGMSD